MYFDRKQLKSALTILRRSIGKNKNFPALQCVLIEPNAASYCTFSTTDLETFTRVRVACDFRGDEPPSPLVIPLKELAAFVRSSKSDQIQITSDFPDATIEADGMSITLDCLSPDAFPEPPCFTPESWTDCSPEFLCAIDTAAHAVSIDETRYNLNGFWLIAEDAGLRVVATDGHRLARRMVSDFTIDSLPRSGRIVPRALMTCAGPTLRKKVNVAQIAFDDRYVGLKWGEIEWTFRLIDGEYSAWEQVVPAPLPEHQVTFSRANFIRTLRAFAKDHSGSKQKVKLEFVARHGVHISSPTRNVVLNVGVSVPDALIGCEVAFNPRYLAESAESLDGDTLYLGVPMLHPSLPKDAPADAPPMALEVALAPHTMDSGYVFQSLNVIMPLRIK